MPDNLRLEGMALTKGKEGAESNDAPNYSTKDEMLVLPVEEGVTLLDKLHLVKEVKRRVNCSEVHLRKALAFLPGDEIRQWRVNRPSLLSSDAAVPAK
jgi:hypothetical protein